MVNDILKRSDRTIILKRGEFLTTAYSTDTNLYFLETGTLHIFIDIDDEEQNIRFGYEGDFVTALDSFLSEEPSDYSIQAIKKCRITVISKKAFSEFLNESEARISHWKNLLESMVLQQLEREKDLLTKNHLERLKRVQERSPKLFQEIPARNIANYLRMSAETYSRLKKY